MTTVFHAAVSLGDLLARVPLDVDALFAYGTVALLIGLVGYNRYTEPAPSPPYGPRDGAKPGSGAAPRSSDRSPRNQ